ncbi:rh5-interacting protein-like isoform X2 [Phlebotomus argentipes]|nr:rh5-interacting protein-like isoform X2 [Phlebotomus argentipes]
MLTGASCQNGVCTCDGDELEMRTYVRGRCRKLLPLFNECQEDLDCDFGFDRESVACKAGTCQCADGFYHRGENICRRISMNVGDSCIINADCQGGDHECVARECSEKSPDDRTEAGVQTDFTDSPTESKSLLTDDTTSNSERRLRDDTKDEGVQFGDSCVNNGEPCAGLAYSTCRKDRCHCKAGYYPLNGICMAELGEEAQSEEQCGTVLRNNKCVCEYDSFYRPNLRTCVRNVLGLQYSCVTHSQCSPFLGMCSSGVLIPSCICHPYKIQDTESQICEMRKGLGEFCEKKEDCSVSKTACQPDNTCACDDSYIEVDEQCKPAITGSCESNEDCAVDNTECMTDSADKEDETAQMDQKVCRCKEGFTHTANTECLPNASKYGDECVESEQCQPLLGTLGQCIDGECACDEEKHHHKDGKCHEKKVLEESCTKSSECFVIDNSTQVECRNNVCQCQYGYYPDSTRIKCVKSTGKNSSGRPSPLKVITMLLITAAILVTSAAIKEAYY